MNKTATEISLRRRAFLKGSAQTMLGAASTPFLRTAPALGARQPSMESNPCQNGSPQEVVRLKVPVSQIHAPTDIYSPPSNGGSLITQPDGVIRFLYRLYQQGETATSHEGSGSILFEDRSEDGGQSWQLGLEVMTTGTGSGNDVAHVNPYTGEIYLFYMRGQQTFLKKSCRERTDWLPDVEVPFPCVWDSFGFTWLDRVERTGAHRLVVVATIRPGGDAAKKKVGTASYFSDDDGVSWTGPSNLVSTDDVPGRWHNPSSSGQVVELSDGRLWLLTRSSQNYLWQAYSEDRGRSWAGIGPSRFTGIFSNVRLERIAKDKLLIVWLNSMPHSNLPRDSSFHNTARDVLHASISLDEGKTWRGFREIVLDRNRNKLIFETTLAFDAGVHHPKLTVTSAGKIVVMTGQDDERVRWGSPHRRAVLFDPEWLLEENRETEFSNGLDEVCASRLSERRLPPTNYYARAPGARLAAHPTQPFRDVLHLGREPASWVLNEQDGATWNFPAGLEGSLKTRILLRDGFKGAAITLTDVYYNPSDNAGEHDAVFLLNIPPEANGKTYLNPGQWHELEIQWRDTRSMPDASARLYVDGALRVEELRAKRPSINGINYVRFRSTAQSTDLAGFLVASVRAEVRW